MVDRNDGSGRWKRIVNLGNGYAEVEEYYVSSSFHEPADAGLRFIYNTNQFEGMAKIDVFAQGEEVGKVGDF